MPHHTRYVALTIAAERFGRVVGYLEYNDLDVGSS